MTSIEDVLKVIEETIPGCTIERTNEGIIIRIDDSGARALETISTQDTPWLEAIMSSIKILRERARVGESLTSKPERVDD